MSTNLIATSKRLMQALNSKNYKLTFSTKQFIGRDNNTHTMYAINQATWNIDKDRYDHHELYSSTSLIRITLYLRDLWYICNGWELPTDLKDWNRIREGLNIGRDGT